MHASWQQTSAKAQLPDVGDAQQALRHAPREPTSSGSVSPSSATITGAFMLQTKWYLCGDSIQLVVIVGLQVQHTLCAMLPEAQPNCSTC